jgi:hypothetical protein
MTHQTREVRQIEAEASQQPDNDDRRLDTKAAAEYLTVQGFKVAPATLNKYRCVGGGPEYDLFGRTPLYRPARLREWREARTRFGLRSTSDTHGQAA